MTELGPGAALLDSRISTDRAAMGGAGPGPSQKAGRLFGPLHGWNGHGRSLVPSTGGAGTPVLWFPARAERGLEEERCATTGERRGGGGGQRREEKKVSEGHGHPLVYMKSSIRNLVIITKNYIESIQMMQNQKKKKQL